jgi:CRISPR-associated protein Cas1
VRYADDFVIACATRDDAERALETTSRILYTLKLTLHPGKTRIASFDEGFTFLGIHFKGDTLWYEHEGMKIVFERNLPPDFSGWPPPYDRWRR